MIDGLCAGETYIHIGRSRRIFLAAALLTFAVTKPRGDGIEAGQERWDISPASLISYTCRVRANGGFFAKYRLIPTANASTSFSW